MERLTSLQTLYLISNETLESLLKAKLNRATYEGMADTENIIPQEFVDAGIRQQKTAGDRKKELNEQIETKQHMMNIIDEMILEEENKTKGNEQES